MGRRSDYMHPKSKQALEWLQQFEWAWLTGDETQVVKRDDGDVLLMNSTTAGSLVRRELAEFVDTDDDREADVISILKKPANAL